VEVHSSKSSAARWALDRDPPLTAVEAALVARVMASPVRITPYEVKSVLLRVLRDVE